MSYQKLTPITAKGATAPRYLEDRFADVINVKDFGAKGDGVTDDTAAIQAALDYANTVSDNRPVVAFGTFLISNTLNVGRPSATRQDKPEQHFIFEAIIVDAAHWVGASSSPAINLRGWRAIIEGPSKLICNKACAGIKIDTFGAKVINPVVINFAPNSYGLTWTSGGNCVFNPMINHDRATEAAMLQNMTTPGILCNSNSIDSKVFGGTIGNCSPGIDFKSGTSFNFFHGTHIYCGSSEHPVTDPVLVRYASTSPNYMFNCYFDSGHVDIEKTSLRISGGHYFKNTNIATVNGKFIRCHPEDSSGNFANLNVFNVHNASASFTDGTNEIPDTFDYSVINALEISGGQEFRYERQTKRVLANNFNAPFEDVYKPVGTLCRDYHVADGVGVRVSYLDNGVRIQDPSNGAGARLYLGGGSSGIGENPDQGGQTWIYANGVAHLQMAGDGVVNGYVRPGVTDKDTLGSAQHLWKDIYCASTTINPSDERIKQQIASVPDAVFRAWGKVGFVQYKLNKAVEEKGEAARLHTGMIAQRILEAFESEGLDATKYGLLCYDEWEAEEHTVKIVDAPAVVDEEDRTVEPECSHEEKITEPAGSRYSLRYEECLCMEAAYQRWRLEQIEARLASLEVK